jgi:hypothetical protein
MVIIKTVIEVSTNNLKYQGPNSRASKRNDVISNESNPCDFDFFLYKPNTGTSQLAFGLL